MSAIHPVMLGLKHGRPYKDCSVSRHYTWSLLRSSETNVTGALVFKYVSISYTQSKSCHKPQTTSEHGSPTLYICSWKPITSTVQQSGN